MSLLTNKFFLMVLPAILNSISPILINQLRPLLDQLKETAEATPNPWDNILVVFLEDLLEGLAPKGG